MLTCASLLSTKPFRLLNDDYFQMAYPYTLLPFRFGRIADQILLVNEAGEYLFLPADIFRQFIKYSLPKEHRSFLDLKSKHLVTDTELNLVIEMLATKYRTKKAFLLDFVCLHMIVPTIRCNCNCRYCQVASKGIAPPSGLTDMSSKTAANIIRNILQCPSKNIKIEFQGGEPTLNFPIIKYIIDECSKKHEKNIEYVVCSNLTEVSNDMLRYFKANNIILSSSLDGTKEMHDKNRLRLDGKSSYDMFVSNIERVRTYLGKDGVSALLTVTNENINYLREVVDEYRRIGFYSIFIRPINPYGRARCNNELPSYSPEQFIEAYLDALTYCIQLNMDGEKIIEEFALILLQRILTPFPTYYVDLQSPAGAGIQCAIYNHDGNVYVSDEGRMLAEMGDKTFLMGNVNEQDYAAIFHNEFVRSLVKNSLLECSPLCSDCPFLPYCGSDPVRDYVENRALFMASPSSASCRQKKPIFEYLMKLIQKNDDAVMDVFWSWLTKRPYNQVHLQSYSNDNG